MTHHSELAFERFIARVNKCGRLPEDRPEIGHCWEWTLGLMPNGYAVFTFGRQRTYAHRWSYMHHKGPIPENLQIDHLCRNRCCVNPDHLEAVTQAENLMRGNTVTAINAAKTHCPQGHPYSGDNLHISRGGTRVCKHCQRDHARNRYQRLAKDPEWHDAKKRAMREAHARRKAA